MKKPHEQLAASNWQRVKSASERDVIRARSAIQAIQAIPVKEMTLEEVRLRQRYLQVLRERVQHPQAALRQLAHRCGVTKDVYGARLKRAFAFADRMKEQYEH